MDAQFGGVDQRKIFTFAEKVRTRAVGQPSVTLASGLGLRHSLTHWEKRVWFQRVLQGLLTAPALLFCGALLCRMVLPHVPSASKPVITSWLLELPGARSRQGLWVEARRTVRDAPPCFSPVPPVSGLCQAHPFDEPDGSRADRQQNELVRRGWSLSGGCGQRLCGGTG